MWGQEVTPWRFLVGTGEVTARFQGAWLCPVACPTVAPASNPATGTAAVGDSGSVRERPLLGAFQPGFPAQHERLGSHWRGNGHRKHSASTWRATFPHTTLDLQGGDTGTSSEGPQVPGMGVGEWRASSHPAAICASPGGTEKRIPAKTDRSRLLVKL